MKDGLWVLRAELTRLAFVPGATLGCGAGVLARLPILVSPFLIPGSQHRAVSSRLPYGIEVSGLAAAGWPSASPAEGFRGPGPGCFGSSLGLRAGSRLRFSLGLRPKGTGMVWEEGGSLGNHHGDAGNSWRILRGSIPGWGLLAVAAISSWCQPPVITQTCACKLCG